ncbi:V-type ATP synthase subunit D [bacterium]|nr:MAG: V-type ATP synthase subunit D [bacterium]
MEKIKLTKGELKKQRDALKQYERYLPTLQLKKQQIQMEILYQLNLLEEKRNSLEAKKKASYSWAGLLSEAVFSKDWVRPDNLVTRVKNIAGVDIPVFEKLEFIPAEYDLFYTPLWLDGAIDSVRNLISLSREIKLMEEGVSILKHELRITNQRVNLFEKVKIPQTKEAIRLIKIYIGDQMTNAVGRSKIAKNKIENNMLEGAFV